MKANEEHSALSLSVSKQPLLSQLAEVQAQLNITM